MGKHAVVFPGQGVQTVGMGKDLYESFDEAREIIERANRILGMDLKRLMFEGPIEELTRTENAQPAILTVNYVLFRLAVARSLRFDGAAGHSLGEYNALISAGSIDFDEALIAVRRRGRLMEEIGTRTKGTMAAIIGFDEDSLREVCRQASEEGIVEISNYNCPGQLVISGEVAAVLKACDLAKKAGARRAIRLNVSGAFHSSLLAEASEELGRFLDGVRIGRPACDLYQNVTGTRQSDPAVIKGLLARQVSSPVLWEATIRAMLSDGYDSFTEIGPGTVITGLVSQITKDAHKANINSIASLEALAQPRGS